MAHWIVPPITGLIEPAPAPVIWIDDIGAIALDDGVASIYYCARRPDLYGDGLQWTVELIVQRRVVSVIDEFPKMFALVQRMIASEHGKPPAGLTPSPSRPRLVT
ncbi:MAG TPA: hypothetical protein VII92_08345 [Anaerolineae bacterium]